MYDSLKRNDVFNFYCLTNYAIIRYRILWSAIRIATVEHKQIKKEAR